MLYIVPGVPICGVYCNTLLANLNARVYLGGNTTQIVDMDLFTSSNPQSESNGTGWISTMDSEPAH